jgi:hypothetical protein
VSYDVWLEVDLGGPEPVRLDTLDANHTSNTGGMIEEAAGKPIREWDKMPAGEVAELALRAACDLRRRPAYYDAMAPTNGWGTRESTIAFLDTIEAACRAAPKATFRNWF